MANHSVSRIIFMFVILGTFSCVNTVDDLQPNHPAIQEALKRKEDDFLKEMMGICKKEAITKAESYVDSMVAANFFLDLSGTIPFPPKPDKPVFQGPITIKDTIDAAPFRK